MISLGTENRKAYIIFAIAIAIWLEVFPLSTDKSLAWAIQGKDAPVVKQGLLDLRGWDFATDGIVNLSGQWGFYWLEHISPERFGQSDNLEPERFINVPGSWNGFEEKGKKLSGHGYATYHVRVLLNYDQGPLALKLLDMATAFTLFVNGEKLVSSGIAGKTAKSTSPYYSPQIAKIKNNYDQLDIVIHVSNFHHWQGGMWEPVLLGSDIAIKKVRDKKLATLFFLLGSIIIMGVYHLGLFAFRTRNTGALFFGIFCLLIAIRILFTGERFIIGLFPGISYELLMKSVYVSFYLCVPFFAMFAQQMFPKEFSWKIMNGITFSGCFFSLIVVFCSSSIYTYTMPVYQVFTLVFIIYGTIITIKAIVKKRLGSLIFAVGGGVLFLSVINDILYTRQIITTGHFVSAGLFVFLSFQSVLISRKFSTAFFLVEEQRAELLDHNQAHKEELKKRKLTQTALEKSEEQFRSLIEQTADGVCIAQEGAICYVNPSFCELLGETKEDVLGKSFLGYIHPDDQMIVMERYQKRLSGEITPKRYTIRGVDKNGEVHDLELSSSLVQWQAKPSILVFIRDITQQKKTQEMLIQSEKMMSVGGLAAGMAHEINNPLAGMMQNAQVASNRLIKDLPANEKAAQEVGTTMAVIQNYARKRKVLQSLKNITLSGQNAAKIVQNMLSFVRKGESLKSRNDIRRIMDNSLALAGSDYDLKKNYDFRKIKIIKNFSLQLTDIMCEPVEIQQVFFNLLKNAAEAMATTEPADQSPKIIVDIFQDSGSVCIQIKDNGPGMTKEDRKRCFEPFYTTKEVDKGTGLGLSVSYFIITDIHNGEMYVDSSPGKGSQFVIHLPDLTKTL